MTPEREAEIRRAGTDALTYYPHTRPGAVGVVVNAQSELWSEIDRLRKLVKAVETNVEEQVAYVHTATRQGATCSYEWQLVGRLYAVREVAKALGIEL